MNSQILGQVLGEALGAVLGDELDGEDIEGENTLGAARRRRVANAAAGNRGALIRLPVKPKWRDQVLTPGVNAPSEGHEPLPLTPSANGGVFSATTLNIDFTARPQRPYQATRLLASVIKTGTTAAASSAVCGGIFIGTNLQQLQLGYFNLEFFAPTAFGVGLNLAPAEAGIDIVLRCNLSAAVTGTDTIAVQLMLLGSSLR